METRNKSLTVHEAVVHHEEHDEKAQQQISNRAEYVWRHTQNPCADLFETGVQHVLKLLNLDSVASQSSSVIENALDALQLQCGISTRQLLRQLADQENCRKDHQNESDHD